MHAKGASVPFEDEKFSWLAVSREQGPVAATRILGPPAMAKPGITFRLCTPDGIATRMVPRRDASTFRAARHLGWGDAVDMP